MLNNGSSLTFFSSNHSNNESIVAPCSTNLQSNDGNCFTNSACYIDNAVIKATGQLQWQDLSNLPYVQNVSNKRWGTAFFITPNVIMSAGHCFDVVQKPNGGWITPKYNSQPLTPGQFAPLIKLNMDYAHRDCQPLSGANLITWESAVKITRLIEHRNGNLDYAIAEVEGNPGNIYGYLSFAFDFQEGSIFAAQHPAGEPKKFEEGYGWSFEENGQRLIDHNVNTLGGSSGSALAVSANHLVCGVHIQGTGRGKPYNTGVHIHTIFQKSPFLQQMYNQQNPSIPIEPALPKTQLDLLEILGIVAAGGAIGAGATWTMSKNKNTQKIAAASAAILTGVSIGLFIASSQKKKSKETICTPGCYN